MADEGNRTATKTACHVSICFIPSGLLDVAWHSHCRDHRKLPAATQRWEIRLWGNKDPRGLSEAPPAPIGASLEVRHSKMDTSITWHEHHASLPSSLIGSWEFFIGEISKDVRSVRIMMNNVMEECICMHLSSLIDHWPIWSLFDPISKRPDLAFQNAMWDQRRLAFLRHLGPDAPEILMALSSATRCRAECQDMSRSGLRI